MLFHYRTLQLFLKHRFFLEFYFINFGTKYFFGLKVPGVNIITFPSPEPARMSPFFKACIAVTPRLYLFFSGPIALYAPFGYPI